MLDALGAPPLPASRGRSVLPLLRNENTDWSDVAFSEYCTDDGCYHRMIRDGAWKLNYYHGQPSQLFNLKEDPNEQHDRATDPGCQAILTQLTEKVLENWNPEQVAALIAAKRADTQILGKWGRNTQPADQYRWNLRPEMNCLD